MEMNWDLVWMKGTLLEFFPLFLIFRHQHIIFDKRIYHNSQSDEGPERTEAIFQNFESKWLELGMKVNIIGEILAKKEREKSSAKASCCLDLDEG